MLIPIDDATRLVERAMRAVGFTSDEAQIIGEHLIGCELRGVPTGGFSRALSIVERMRSSDGSKPISVLRETPVSALLDGGDKPGYLVAHRATTLVIDKARSTGLAAVAANNTWYTGMYAHYMEMVTRAGMVAMCAGSSSPRVAPFGSSAGRFGTNPIAFGFPSSGDPIIVDTATSGLIVGDVVLAARMNQPIPPGYAYDAEGQPTVDSRAALEGALAVWGGHRGSALAIAIQLLGIMAGGGALPADYRDCGFFIVAWRPDLFMSSDEFEARVADYAQQVRSAPPLDPARAVRMPFDRSAEHRRERLAQGTLEISDNLFVALEDVARAAP